MKTGKCSFETGYSCCVLVKNMQVSRYAFLRNRGGLVHVLFKKFAFVTHTHPFNGPLSGTTRVGRYQKGKTKLDFTEARDSE